jgi:hypothetical protein
MIDFVAHATLLKPFWDREYSALKSLDELFVLIPFGYASFLLLTLLAGWVYARIYSVGGNVKKGIFFGVLFGGLFALSTFFAWYSAIELPLVFIFLISLVYFVEMFGVSLVFGYLYHPRSIKKRFWLVMAAVFLGLVIGVVIQNVNLAS